MQSKAQLRYSRRSHIAAVGAQAMGALQLQTSSASSSSKGDNCGKPVPGLNKCWPAAQMSNRQRKDKGRQVDTQTCNKQTRMSPVAHPAQA